MKNENRKAGRKNSRRAALALAAVLLLGGCGDASAEASADAEVVAEAGTEAKEVSIGDLYRAIEEAVTLPDMYEADDDFLMNYYGIDTSLLSEYVFSSCEDAARVDSVILMRLKDGADAPALTAGLEGLLAQMEAEMDNYNPEAHDLVADAAVRRHGDLLELVISADREQILSVIDDLID